MTTDQKVREVLAWLKRRGSKSAREGMARYGIVANKVFGVSVDEIRLLGKKLGRNHALALKLWASGWYDARMLAPFVDEPARVTPAQMDRWARDFDSWAVCDAACFHLFDRTPHAFKKVAAWSRRKEEFVKRAAFALLASMALHDKKTPDAPFARTLPLIARAAKDPRNFVKKGVSWALRGVGARSPRLRAASVKLAKSLAVSTDSTERWVGKDALRDLTRPMVKKRAEARSRAR